MVSLVKGVGIGASVGAGLGALSSDDGYGTGALRGGIAGAGIGGMGANKFYNGKLISSKNHGTDVMIEKDGYLSPLKDYTHWYYMNTTTETEGDDL